MMVSVGLSEPAIVVNQVAAGGVAADGAAGQMPGRSS